MEKNYYRVDITEGLPKSKKRYSVSDVRYCSKSKKSAVNKAKKERFKASKEYKLFYETIKIGKC